MTNAQIKILVDKYFRSEGYRFPTDFEHRYDPESSAVLYSLIRHFKPTVGLHIGTWHGGSLCIVIAALLKNKIPFHYVASELLDNKRDATRRNVVKTCGIEPILIGDITKNLDKVPDDLDLLFIDTDHDRDTTKWIVDNIFPKCKEGALVAIHDWAVEEIDGKWIGKGANGTGGLPETQYLMDLHKEGMLPFKKLYWNYHNPLEENGDRQREASFWMYRKL